MSDAIVLPPPGEAETKKVPTVYFIDDSATMREVIKIAFRRENHPRDHLRRCRLRPRAVRGTSARHRHHRRHHAGHDGYSVCSQMKQNPQFAKTPVILMSGVVNKNVADRAVAVQADELVRKPFQPQELLTRVKNLIGIANPGPTLQQPSERPVAVPSLSSLFSPPAAPRVVPPPAVLPPTLPHSQPHAAEVPWSRAVADALAQQGSPMAAHHPAPAPVPVAPSRPAASASDIQKFRVEISRLELLIKKLQTELQIERQYNQALELHVRTLTQVD